MENLYCMDKLDDMDGTPHTNVKLITWNHIHHMDEMGTFGWKWWIW
jgi:hypothetical protein